MQAFRPPQRTAGPAPSASALREAALRHLARFAATRAGLLRVLDRRIDRWLHRAQGEALADAAAAAASAQDAARAHDAAARVVEALAGEGLVDDAAFAEARHRRLSRAGRSARAIEAALAKAGVDAATAQTIVETDADAEFDRALLAARRKRIGPFARPGETPDRQRALGQLARAGFGREVAQRVLSMPAEDAEARVLAIRRI